uniref:Uncharacterized protein n=1 Tax=Salarias fasciatus TaxID=181472 RepID=A0A672I4X5_SALFA
MEAIISAAETGFTGSLWGSGLTRPAAYMGTMTGCFFLDCLGATHVLTMFLVSMPRQQSSDLLQCEPCVHTPPRCDLRAQRRGSPTTADQFEPAHI